MKVATGLTLFLVTLLVFIDADATRTVQISSNTKHTVYYNWTERLTGNGLNVHAAAIKGTLLNVIMTSIGSGLWISSGSEYGQFTPSITAYHFNQDSVMGIVSYGTPTRCFILEIFDNGTFASTAALLASRNGTAVTVDRKKVYLNTTGFVSSAVIRHINSTTPLLLPFLDHQCDSLSTIYHSEILEDALPDDTLIVNTLTKEIHIQVNP
ncbi:uncharacterized protein [Littorina saxatilis]